jgi:multiple sugar transport system ATP-binding protein
MTVRDNLAFGLRLKKLPKAEWRRRVDEVAKTLGLEELLDRKPSALSGGQRQRVAMGRAIVREPKAFLMDEPLSNLDAKLRVEMRAYIARLHQELKTTTLYVTHDQSEAMTMGDRVALMRDGRIEQLDKPNTLYDQPRNLFVAGFIGSPAMNIVRGRLSGGSVTAGGLVLPLHRDAAKLAPYDGREVLVGIRPEAFADAAHEASTDGRHLFEARISLAQSMGSEVIAHFEPAGGSVQTEDVSSFTGEQGDVAGRDQLSSAHQLIGRFDPRTKASAASTMTVSLDLTRIHFFDPETELAI